MESEKPRVFRKAKQLWCQPGDPSYRQGRTELPLPLITAPAEESGALPPPSPPIHHPLVPRKDILQINKFHGMRWFCFTSYSKMPSTGLRNNAQISLFLLSKTQLSVILKDNASWSGLDKSVSLCTSKSVQKMVTSTKSPSLNYTNQINARGQLLKKIKNMLSILL